MENGGRIVRYNKLVGMLKIALTAWLLGWGGFAAAANHPLDSLSEQEYKSVVDVLRKAGHVDAGTIFNSISLLPPEKALVEKWAAGKPFPRNAVAIVGINDAYYRAQVDLTTGKLVSWAPAAGQGPIVVAEMKLASAIAMKDARFVEAMKRRGLTEANALRCVSLASGTFGKQGEENQRNFKTTCVARHPGSSLEVPIEGVVATVDVRSRRVIDFVDTGVVPLAPDPWGHTREQIEARFGKRAPEAHKTVMSQVDGPGYVLDGGHLQWDIWRLNFSTDERPGVMLNDVEVRDGDKWRNVLYEMYLSEVFVPYSDPAQGWYWRTYMDSGEYGFGSSMTTLTPGVDCPPHATFVDTIGLNPDGTTVVRKATICIFERTDGDPAWRRLDDGRAATDLVIRYASAVGNYDYLLDYIFRQDGSIKVKVGAVGIDAVKGVAATDMESPTAGADTRYGTLIRPNIVAPNHTHFFNFRLDFDIDGEPNSFMKMKLVPTEVDTSANVPRKSIWTVAHNVPARELDAVTRFDLAAPSMLGIYNPNVKNALKQNPSYMLMAEGSAAYSLLDPTDSAVKRNAYVDNQFWVTPYRSDERYAGGKYAMQSNGEDTLQTWVNANRPIKNTDIVSWYTVAFHHVPRSEDWPVMPAHWVGFTLMPHNFFERNPALNISPTASDRP